MIQHLAQISHGRHAVVIMDGAVWHTNDIAEPFSNAIIIKPPSLLTRVEPYRTSMTLTTTTLPSQPKFDER
ncbi:hypothetical protein ACODM8_20735, partial [Vibrio ostreicida]